MNAIRLVAAIWLAFVCCRAYTHANGLAISATCDGGALVMSWTNQEAALYTVEVASSLTASNWAALPPTGQWPIAESSWTSSWPLATAFYRIWAVPATTSPVTSVSFMDFNTLPATDGLDEPGSFPPWRYTTATINPQGDTWMTAYDCAGWLNTNQYGPNTNRQTQFYLYFNTYNSVHMGFSTYGYLEVDSANAVAGNSLRYLVTGGVNTGGTNGLVVKTKSHYTNWLNQGINPGADGVRAGHPYLYFGNTAPNDALVPIPEARHANRMNMSYHAPASLTNVDSVIRPFSTVNIGPFNGQGGHWYHEFCTQGGGWTLAVCDGHPQHNNAWSSPTNYPYPSKSMRDMGEAYFTNWYRWYITFKPYTGVGTVPYDIWFDEITFEHDPEPQNNETICSPSIVYFPSNQAFEIGFMDKYKDNARSYSTYELRYAFREINNANWDSATPARILTNARYRIQSRADGKFQKCSPYYQAVWAPFELSGANDATQLVPGATIWFAVKDISQIGGDSPVPVTNSGIGPHIMGGRDYSTYSTNFDFAGDQPALPLIKRVAYRIPSSAHHGVIAVAFAPTNMLAAGARWRVNNGVWNARHSQWLPEGVHTVEYAAVNGWIAPAPATVTVFRAQTIQLAPAYQPSKRRKNAGDATR